MEKTKIMIDCHEKFVDDDLTRPNIHGMLDEMLALHDASVADIEGMDSERQTFVEGLHRLDTGWIPDANSGSAKPRFSVQVGVSWTETWYIHANDEQEALATVMAWDANGGDAHGASHEDHDWDNAKVTRSPV